MMHHTNSGSVETRGAGLRGSRLQQEPSSKGTGEQEERTRLLVEMAELLDHNPFLDMVDSGQRTT